MRRAATAVALFAALLLTACGGPDLAGCEQAMRDQFDAAMTSDEEGTRPAECDGVSDEVLADMAEGIVAEMIAEVFEE